MKTPYMNIKENQGFLMILVIVIAFLMLSSMGANAQISVTGLSSLLANGRSAVPSGSTSVTFSITEQPVPMNDAINTHFIELKPVMAPCGNRLYFSRLADNLEGSKNAKDEDIWYTDFNKVTYTWSAPQRLDGPLNNAGPNFVNSISPKGDTLILGNRYTRKGKMVAGLSYSVKENGQWSAPQAITVRNDYNMSEHANHYVSFQQHVIISAIEPTDSQGERDLYVSFWDGGTATEPINMGQVLNTALDESSPFLSNDGKTLFFASKGHDGFGGYDIYMTTRLDNSWTNWSQPVNLGPAVNTSNDEEHFSITRCGKYGLFSRQQGANNVDLFHVNIGTDMNQLAPQPFIQPAVNSFASL